MKMEPTLSEIAEKMKCSNCTGYLRPPINYCSDGTNVCGLCENKVTTLGVNTCLESIGDMLNFPCKYVTNKCPLKLPWKVLKVHEIRCPYRQCTCPFCICEWQGNVSALQKHILRKHDLCKMEVELSLLETLDGIRFLQVGEEIYFVHIKGNSRTGWIWINMKSIKPLYQISKKYFRVTISANGSRYVDFKPVEYALNWNLNRDMALKVDICVLKIKLQMKSNDYVNIGFEVLTRKPVNNDKREENMLTDLECPVCHEYMAVLIYQCVVGHSICSHCKPKLQSCPFCRSPFSTSSRNYTLESISNTLDYKCMYAEQGCTFTSSLGQIQNHEGTCDHGHCDCPLKDFVNCSWRGRFHQMRSHARDEHALKFWSPSAIISPF